jgi:hypothetical protein
VKVFAATHFLPIVFVVGGVDGGGLKGGKEKLFRLLFRQNDGGSYIL